MPIYRNNLDKVLSALCYDDERGYYVKIVSPGHVFETIQLFEKIEPGIEKISDKPYYNPVDFFRVNLEANNTDYIFGLAGNNTLKIMVTKGSGMFSLNVSDNVSVGIVSGMCLDLKNKYTIDKIYFTAGDDGLEACVYRIPNDKLE